MEIKQLKYFLAVSECGSFSKAAVLFSVAQSALSRHVRSLEEELGAALFYRNGRGVVVTESGNLLIDYARTIVDSAKEVSQKIEMMREAPGGQLVLGVPPTANAILSAPLVHRFRKDFPRVKLKVQEGFSGHVLEWLSTGRIDVGVLYDAPRTSTLVTEPLIEEELFLIGPPDVPARLLKGSVSAAELARLPLILPSHPHGLRRLVDSAFSDAGVEPNIECEIDSLPCTLNLVAQSVGYTILPHASIFLRGGAPLSATRIEPSITRQLVLATSTQRPMTGVTRSLAKAIVTLVDELVADGVWKSTKKDAPSAATGGAAQEPTCASAPRAA
ncbi:LysR family transcriptional regulator [Acuticoccus mangrovi]|uniref:LysR family transcriptional regulator n=1 Tax=Acuticoccus mangrovi TaxID=2796142 RepID=A0A934MJB1_9HYPH|nr:LysR substrate-binding domain-containing protein [Acuticoccus mangrovi]MBJ3778106.1 LysR family transcriptional regulator [Acuticoccus mangrovi]